MTYEDCYDEIKHAYPAERPAILITDDESGERKTVGPSQLSVVNLEIFELLKKATQLTQGEKTNDKR